MIATPRTDNLKVMNQLQSAIQMGSNLGKFVASAFARDAKVFYVPTGTQLSGQVEIESFLRKYQQEAHLIEKTQEISSVSTNNQVVQEILLQIKHTESINWLLPGVRPTRKDIAVVVISITSFNEDGQIANKRVYWDQASVLRQVGVLPQSLFCRANNSETTLPIVGDLDLNDYVANEEQTVQQTQAPVENKRLNSRRNESSDIFGEAQTEFRPSSRVLSIPGGSTSGIFDPNPPPTPLKTGLKISSQKPGGDNHNVFSDDDQPIAVKHRRDPNWSSVEEPVNAPKSRPYSGKTNESHFEFGQDETVVLHTGKKVNPTSNESQFSFAQEEFEPSKFNSTKRNPNAETQQVDSSRPSSRVLNVPGGRSNFSFGDDTVTQRVQSTTENNIQGRPSSRVLAVPGGASTFSFAHNEAPVRTGRRDPNAMSVEPIPRVNSHRHQQSAGGNSTLTLN